MQRHVLDTVSLIHFFFQEQEQAREDPVVRLERENKHLRTANLRLERESDDLAQELITSKIGLRSELDSAEEKADAYFKELQSLKRLYKELEEDKIQMQNEAVKVLDHATTWPSQF